MENKAKELKRVLNLLANKHRLAILQLLKAKGEMSVGGIADRLEIPFNTASKNLLCLARGKILKRRYDGLFVLYKIAPDTPKLTTLIIESLLTHSSATLKLSSRNGE